MIAKLFKRSKGNENDQEVQRRIFVNLDLPQDMIDPKSGLPSTNYPRNKIRTTKYTPVTFLPKNIFFQFTNIANSYFLLIIILGAFQIFGVQSPGMQAVPLIVIVVLTAIKDGFEDYRRAVSDLELNNSRIHILTGLDNPNVIKDHVGPWRRFKKACTRGMRATVRALSPKKKNQSSNDADNLELERVDTLISSIDTEHPARLSMSTNRSRPHAKLSPFHPGTVCNPNIKPDMALKFTNKYWKDISVGDIIRVRNNEEIPADAVILASSDPEGACYVETKNLDGETNLKNKVSIHCGQGLKHANDFERVQMAIETEAPNLNLYKFRGVIKYRGFESENDIEGKEMMEPATYENILLRGTTLRNTKWVLCAVVATGNDTKIMLNSGVTPTKKSRISKDLNLSVIFNFFILFILCFVSGLINGLYYRKDDTSRRFFEYKPYAGWNAAPNGVVAFFVALILYQTLVPISLYISIEIIKTVQAYFIYADVGMYYKKLDFPCTPKSWNISDDLGQIEYIFSDKTGTLTQNVMEFKKCTIAGKSYGLAYTEAQQGMDKRAGVDVVAENIKMQKVIKEDKLSMIEGLNTLDNDQLKDGAVTFISSEFVKDTLLSNDAARKQANEEFMLALSLCHTVITETTEDGYIDFKAESPDEAALVSVARDIGIVFREKTRSGQVITKYDPTKPLTYEILEIIPFNSTRKRMSIVLRGPDGRIIMYTKGADNVIYERLGPDSDEEILSKTAIHLSEFAQEGLRTLCIAQKYINSDDFEKWHAKYKEASNSIDDDREEKLELIGEELESGMTLLGGTAIEDRLQEGVPDSISILSKAGIKLWVLTGDKVETAINIGFSCNLLANEMELLVIKSNDDASPENETVDQLVATYLTDKFGLEGSASDLAEAKKDHSPPSGNFALIIDGVSLHQIFEDAELTLKFLLLCKQCRSVLCCRVSPAQKAQIVKMVKDNLNVMTLAVGDGANDVAMIQAANVGVGIAGEEGRQAVMSSDYAIGQFRFLVRLIIVHGRWSYKRLSEMIPCFFYKNVNFVMALFWFGIFDNFEGAYLYEYTYLMFFNLAFTSLPVIFLGILDQDVTDVVSLMVPELYRSGILGLEWSQFKFFYYMLDGAYQSVIAFYFPWLLYHKGVFVNQHGLGLDHRFWVGVFCAHISVISCNVYVLLQQKRWDWLSGIIYAFSILIIFFWTGVWSSSTASQEFYKVASQCYGTVAFWCVFFIGVLSSLLPRFSYDILNRLYYPKDIDIVRERAAMGDFKSYPSNYDPTDQELVAQFRAKVNETGSNSGSFSSEFDEKKDIEAGNEDGGIGSRKNTIKRLLHLGNTKNDISKQKTPLEVMRENMVLRGEASARSSAQIIRSSHDLGIASAEGLMKLHTRNSNLSRS
ncbi:hypothetical protein CANARDRAFT_196601 [[Candida] arabinofermentans NRRL YB-2248]|uniref:Phospholipid-transporting ATPase n=1 Tax=[Candida] arabinofermentans NRRL YB-2248 TaxID=983967 RepID=A0A1E4T3R8_9ASCO|nr:hypothetical protein CANARDRAFT_196601 [[Candida] arabinofermentans NRRL YB-2248]